jgi:hypothetical protein
MKPSIRPLHLLVVIGLAAIFIAVVQATTESFMVQPGQEVTRPIKLNADDRCSITLTVQVQGPSPSKIHFFMVLPNGTQTDYGEVSQYRIDFFTDTSGECQLHFGNSNSSDSQLVTLNYETDHYVFGIPNMIFMLIVITVLLVFVAAGYVLMGKYG